MLVVMLTITIPKDSTIETALAPVIFTRLGLKVREKKM